MAFPGWALMRNAMCCGNYRQSDMLEWAVASGMLSAVSPSVGIYIRLALHFRRYSMLVRRSLS